MSGALNGCAVRVTRTPPAVTDSVCSAAGAWLACAAGSACPAGSTCAPWVRARHRDAKSDHRYRAVASGCAAREPVTASSAAPPLVRARLHAREPIGHRLPAPPGRLLGQGAPAGGTLPAAFVVDGATTTLFCRGWSNDDKPPLL